MDWAIQRSSQYLWTSDRTQKQAIASKSSLGNFQHWYLPDMLASVYSYGVMMKSIFLLLRTWKIGFPKSSHKLCSNDHIIMYYIVLNIIIL